jgi:hypothetical protein
MGACWSFPLFVFFFTVPVIQNLTLLLTHADAAIDMSCYHWLKATYYKSTGRDEPSVFASLVFGAISGAIGASSALPS